MWSPLKLTAPGAGSAAAANAALQLLSVDPWSHGKRRDLVDPNTYLSFPNATQALVDQLSMPPEAALGIAVTASNLTDMAHNLSSLGNAFPLPDLQRLGRRAAALLDLATAKFDLVPYGSAERSINLSSLPAIRAMKRADLIKASADNATAFLTSNPIAALADLLSDKASFVAGLAGIQSSASAGLSGSPPNCFRFYAEANIASALLAGHPDHDFTLTSILLFMGPKADLALLKGVFA